MQIIGRITADAQVRTFQDNRTVVNFTVAENHDYKNKQTGQWVKRATFYRCAYWLTDKVAKALTKGRLVELTGRVEARAWQGANGENRVNLELIAAQIKFHGSGKRQQGNATVAVAGDSGSQSGDIDTVQSDDLPF